MDGSPSDMKIRVMPTAATRQPLRKAVVASSLVAGLALTAFVTTPLVITHTTVRNDVLNASVRRLGLHATATEATGGWLSPFQFKNVELTDASGQLTCRLQELQTSQGLLGVLFSGNDRGHFTLVGPDFQIRTDENGKLPPTSSGIGSGKDCSFAIEQGRFRLIVPWRRIPLVDVDDLSIRGSISSDRSGERTLVVESFQVLDHEPLSEAQTEQNLALIAPVLSQATRLTGSASVWVDEIRITLNSETVAASPFPIRGRTEFHSLEAHLKQDWARQVAQLTGHVTKTTVPDRIEVAKDSTVRFSVTESGIHHESMVFLLPELASGLRAETSGEIQLDETLDLSLVLHMTPDPLPASDNAGQVPAIVDPETSRSGVASLSPAFSVLARLVREPIRLRIRGTVSDPDLQMPDGLTLLDELSRRMAPDQHRAQPAPVAQAVFELIGGVGQPDKQQAKQQLPGSIFNLIRSIKSEKEQTQKAGRRGSESSR